MKIPLTIGGPSGWDAGVSKASEIYGGRMHNLCCDNCHSHVGTALDIMEYGGSSNWTMVSIAARMLFCGKFVRYIEYMRPFFIRNFHFAHPTLPVLVVF